MPWVRLDEEFPDHPKVVQAGPLAAWLHICGIAYCNRYLTDGFIPAAQVPKLADFDGIHVITGGKPGLYAVEDEANAWQLAKHLLDVELWHDVDGGYLIHDYLTYQPSRAKVEAERQQKAEAGRKGGKARSQTPSEAGPQAQAKQSAKHPLKRNASTRSSETQAESKPDPVPVPNTDTSSMEGTSSDTPPPPQRCSKHASMAWVEEPCIPCRNARENYNAWKARQPPPKHPTVIELEKTQAAMRHKVERTHRLANGEGCPHCKGTGWLEQNDAVTECDECHGTGITQKTEDPL